MTTTAIQPWECHVPKSVSLYFVDYNESLDEHEDLQEKCIRQNSMLPLDEESSEWYSEQFSENLRTEMQDIKKSMEKAGLGGEYAENEDKICDMLYDRNDTYPTEGLIRNTSTTTMFYSLGLEIEGYQYGKCCRKHSEAYWCNRIRQILRLRKGQYDDRILEMLMAASYGGELRIYFNAMFNDLVSGDSGQDFKTIRFYGNVVVAIADSHGGSGDHTTLPIDITLPFNRDNLFVDSQVHYSYADEICGMVHDWCDSTKWEPGMKSVKKKLSKSRMTEHQQQEAEYVKTFRKGGCTTGDINISRHRDVYYINDYPCGHKCPHCGTFWVD